MVLLVGGLVFLANKSNKQGNTSQLQEQTIPSISSSEIGLTLKPGSDNQRVVMEVSKTDGIKALDYELSYTAKGDIPRGALGHIDVTGGKPVSKELYLGTCSDVCHPDSDVHNIKVVVKVTKTDGKVYQSEASTELK